MDKTKYAYAAGYIDGDGCFALRKQKTKYTNTILICSTVRLTMNWFKKEFGGSVFLKKAKNSHKPSYHFYIGSTQSLEFAIELLPFLVEKQREAQLYIEFFKSDRRDYIIETLHSQKFYENHVTKEMKEQFESTRNSVTPTQCDFAYLAGFIDSECCLSINRYRDKNRDNFLYKILLQCNNTKAPVFNWVLQRFGGQIHFIDRSHFVPACRNQLTWRLSSKSLYEILDNIYPFLKQKQPVCKELMKFYKTTVGLEGNISRNSPKFKDFYASILSERELIFHKIQSLNHKGT
jgi:hypothetical protein